MEMQQVRYFLAVAQTLNFTRTSEQCNVSQPASAYARNQTARRQLCGELIRRDGRLLHLTVGKRMLPPLKNCYQSAHNAKALARSVKKGEIPTLNVAVSIFFGIAMLMPAINEIYGADIRLRLKRGAGSEIRHMLEKGKVDLAVGGPFGEISRRVVNLACSDVAFGAYMLISELPRAARGLENVARGIKRSSRAMASHTLLFGILALLPHPARRIPGSPSAFFLGASLCVLTQQI